MFYSFLSNKSFIAFYGLLCYHKTHEYTLLIFTHIPQKRFKSMTSLFFRIDRVLNATSLQLFDFRFSPARSCISINSSAPVKVNLIGADFHLRNAARKSGKQESYRFAGRAGSEPCSGEPYGNRTPYGIFSNLL